MKIFFLRVKRFNNVFCYTHQILGAWTLLFFLTLSAFVTANSGDHFFVKVSLSEELRSLDESDSSNFGIYNKCIRRNAIRSIRFQDDQIAIINIGRGKEIVLSLTRPCLGIKRNGFIFSSRSNKLCERFDYFEVMETNMICQIDSIQPHIRLESEY
ncbi:MAG: hypothetical protein CMK29_08315 [Porticoccaceae bacterium]|nr:hypothetical protein [Porticoccaceae bacterium]